MIHDHTIDRPMQSALVAGTMTPDQVGSRFQTHIASTLSGVGVDEQGWNRLAADGATNTVFQTHQWMRSWLGAYSDRFEPLFVTVAADSRVVALAPLVIDHRRPWQRTIRFVGNGRADYSDILAKSNHDEVLVATLAALRSHGRWDVIKLSNVPSESPTVDALRKACEKMGWHILIGDQFVCPSLVVQGNEEAAQRILNKPSLRRPHNYFRRVGELTLRNLTTRREIEPMLETFFAQHVARRKLVGNESMFAESSNRRLFQDLTVNLDGTGWLLFSVVELDGRPIACHFGFDYNGVVTWYKPSFDVAHALHSPGLLMVRHLISHTIEHGRRELDFTTGDEPFKRRFTNTTSKTVEIVICRSAARLAANRLWRTLTGARRAFNG